MLRIYVFFSLISLAFSSSLSPGATETPSPTTDGGDEGDGVRQSKYTFFFIKELQAENWQKIKEL